MGLITWDSIAAQFRPAEAAPLSEVISQVPQDGTEKNDVDIEIQKPAPRVVAEPGVARVEAIQAVWGKNGKYIIIAG
jgi:hypothetical protein